MTAPTNHSQSIEIALTGRRRPDMTRLLHGFGKRRAFVRKPPTREPIEDSDSLVLS
jgi:hypothetical protein